jgi:drug/metabolite transporter (DMT)-like permease
MTFGDFLLALGMFISGTLNTIAAAWAQRTTAVGKETTDNLSTTIWGSLEGDDGKSVRAFNHPFFQACVMFIGEALCLVAFCVKREMNKRNEERPSAALLSKSKGEEGIFTNSIYFSLPAMLDMCGTGVMNAGLCLTYASVFQMLRSAVVVFTALFSVFLLKRRLKLFHWVAIFFVCLGVFVVGYVSIEYSGSGDDAKPTSSVMLGNFLVIIAQAMVAFQMVVEEKIIGRYGAPALKAVGFEGIFGFVILGILLVPLYYIHVSGGAHDYPIEDAVDALIQVGNSSELKVSLACYVCSIAFFNFFGISVTKAMSASHRMVLDSLRTVAVLSCSVALGWEQFHAEQLAGFFFLLLGTGMYNEIVTFPALFDYTQEEGEERESFVMAHRVDSMTSKDGDDTNSKKLMNEPLLANV